MLQRFLFSRVLKPVHLSLYELAKASRSVMMVVVAARSGEGNVLLPLPSLRKKLPEGIWLSLYFIARVFNSAGFS